MSGRKRGAREGRGFEIGLALVLLVGFLSACSGAKGSSSAAVDSQAKTQFCADADSLHALFMNTKLLNGGGLHSYDHWEAQLKTLTTQLTGPDSQGIPAANRPAVADAVWQALTIPDGLISVSNFEYSSTMNSGVSKLNATMPGLTSTCPTPWGPVTYSGISWKLTATSG